MVFGFSWLAEKVMNKFRHDISSKLLSRWRLLKCVNQFSMRIRFLDSRYSRVS
jgi:hypothetical protein